MRITIIILTALLSLNAAAQSAPEWISESSNKSFAEIVQDIEDLIHHRGFKVFSIIKHSEEAKVVNLEMKPTTLIIFGNPKVGTHLMNCDSRIAYHLPLKILVWEDDNKKVKVGFIKTKDLLSNYNLKGCENIPEKIDLAILDIIKSAL